MLLQDANPTPSFGGFGLRSDGSIGILSKGVSGTESRVSTFHSPVGGIFVYTVTPIVIASPLIVNVSLSVAKVVLPVVSN